jgi:hypothetical protein
MSKQLNARSRVFGRGIHSRVIPSIGFLAAFTGSVIFVTERPAHAILMRLPVPCTGALNVASQKGDLDEFLGAMTSAVPLGAPTGLPVDSSPSNLSGKTAFNSCTTVYGLCGKIESGGPYKPGPLDAGTRYSDEAANRAADLATAPSGQTNAEHKMTLAGVIPSTADKLIINVVKRIANLYMGFNSNSNAPRTGNTGPTMQQWRASDNLISFQTMSGPCTNMGACNVTCGEGMPARVSTIGRFPVNFKDSPGGEGVFLGPPSGPQPSPRPLPSPSPCPSPCANQAANTAAFSAATNSVMEQNQAAQDRWRATGAANLIINGQGYTIGTATQPVLSDFSGNGPYAGAATAPSGTVPSGTTTCSAAGGGSFCGWPKHSVVWDEHVASSACAKSFDEYDSDTAMYNGDTVNSAVDSTPYQSTHSNSITTRNKGYQSGPARYEHVDFRSMAWDDGSYLYPGTEGDCDLYFSSDFTEASTITAMMTGALVQANWYKLNEVIEEIKKGSLTISSANCRKLGTTFVQQLIASANTLNAAGTVCGTLSTDVQAKCSSIDQTQSECLQKALVSTVQLGGFTKIAECEVYERANQMFEAAFTRKNGLKMFNQLKNWATLGCIRALGADNGVNGGDGNQAARSLTAIMNNCFPYAYAALFNEYLKNAPTPFTLVPIQKTDWVSPNKTPADLPRIQVPTQCQIKDNTPAPVASPSPAASPTSQLESSSERSFV